MTAVFPVEGKTAVYVLKAIFGRIQKSQGSLKKLFDSGLEGTFASHLS